MTEVAVCSTMSEDLNQKSAKKNSRKSERVNHRMSRFQMKQSNRITSGKLQKFLLDLVEDEEDDDLADWDDSIVFEMMCQSNEQIRDFKFPDGQFAVYCLSDKVQERNERLWRAEELIRRTNENILQHYEFTFDDDDDDGGDDPSYWAIVHDELRDDSWMLHNFPEPVELLGR